MHIHIMYVAIYLAIHVSIDGNLKIAGGIRTLIYKYSVFWHLPIHTHTQCIRARTYVYTYKCVHCTPAGSVYTYKIKYVCKCKMYM